MKTLIVTADDLGSDLDTNAAITRAATDGIVTQASVMGTGTAIDDAAHRFLTVAPVGVHLNLTEARTVTGEVLGATDGEGRLRGPVAVLLACLRHAVDLRAVEREFDEQIARIQAAGFRPTHVDGHHHVHVFPGILGVSCRTARRHGIRVVRLPAESPFLPHPGARGKRLVVNLLSRPAAEALAADGLRAPKHFRGLSLFGCGRTHRRRLLALLEHLPDACTELMVHPRPGVLGEVETESLTHPDTFVTLDRLGIRLVTSDSLQSYL